VSINDETGRRRSFTCPPQTGKFRGIDLDDLDPDDPDDRRFLILAEHPVLQKAIDNEITEIELHGHTINPELHIAVHEVLANQLWDDNPPAAWQTAQRLLEIGYDRHEVLHMLTSVVSDQLWQVLHENRPSDPERYDALVRALPESWEADRRAGRLAHRPAQVRRTGRPKRRGHGR
jgi:hypothetical protein